MSPHRNQVTLRTTARQLPNNITTTTYIHSKCATMSSGRNHTDPRWEHQTTFRTVVSQEEQERARRHGCEVPLLESRLEMYEELNRAHNNLVASNRRVARKNGELVQENDMLRGLHRNGHH
ncbi:hypothetical protein E4T47_07152 [Aureobasidium subglaciale]|nr:hypothetical protein E4T43_06897 [Aureobasidium subglaciale]KAI5269323.1 hypothetical protein E4T47_07152 [Aureobasidium subglaciale]